MNAFVALAWAGLLVAHPAVPRSRSTIRDAAPNATVVLAGGCFWGVEAVFQHLQGVKSVTSGYAVPSVAADSGAPLRHAGYAEAVRIGYDPSRITLAQLLQVFFVIAHDPTELDRQGPDVGPQYRSLVFAADAEQRQAAQAAIAELAAAHTYARPIVTEIVSLKSFRQAEPFHRDYVALHPTDSYVVINDLPKLAELRRRYPDLYRR